MDTVSALLRTYVFQDLSPAEVEGIALACTTVTLAAGEHVFRVGDPAEELWVLVDGHVKEYVLDVDGNEYAIELLGPGAAFGAAGMFVAQRLRVVNEVAMTSATLLRVPRQPLFKFLFAHPPAMLRVLEGLSADTRMFVQLMVMLAFTNLSGRVIARLLQLADAAGTPALAKGDVKLELSQSTLAAMVGATREKVNRALAPLVSAGLVRLEYRRIILSDIVALRRIQVSVELKAHSRHHRETDTSLPAEPAASSSGDQVRR